MEKLHIYLLGFLGQAFFGARLIAQLILSEKAKRVVSPTIFWYLSLAGSLTFLVYGMLRNDPIILIGQLISYFIYVRNLQLKNAWSSIPVLLRLLLIALPFVSIGWFLYNGALAELMIYGGSTWLHPVMVLGTIGQLALNFRFLYQWYVAERVHESVLPVGFWQISVWASVMVIAYALFHPIHGFDPVLLVSQGLGIIVYIRNLVLHYRRRGL